MPAVIKAHIDMFQIFFVGLGTSDGEREVALAPNNQCLRLMLAKIGVPSVVQPDVGLVIHE